MLLLLNNYHAYFKFSLLMCEYTCVHMCVCVCVCICMLMCIHARMCVCAHCVRVWVYVYLWIYLCVCVRLCVCVFSVNVWVSCTFAKIICNNFNRYGREDLEVFGLNFRRDLVDVGVAEHLHCLTWSTVVNNTLGTDAGLPTDVRIEAAADDPATDQTDEEARWQCLSIHICCEYVYTIVTQGYSQSHPVIDTILYIANCSRWKSFVVFTDRSVPQNFSSEIACALGLGHERPPSNCKSFPANYSLVLQLWNFSTSNDLQ